MLPEHKRPATYSQPACRSPRLREARLEERTNSFSRLPVEIFDMILRHILPDYDETTTASEQTPWPLTPHLVGAPVFHLSRDIRQQCIDYINRNVMWISVDLPLHLPLHHSVEASKDSNLLPRRFQCLMGAKPAVIRVCADSIDSFPSDLIYCPPRWRGVFPLTVEGLLDVCDHFDHFGYHQLANVVATLSIDFDGFTGQHERKMLNDIIPALSAWYRHDRLTTGSILLISNQMSPVWEYSRTFNLLDVSQ